MIFVLNFNGWNKPQTAKVSVMSTDPGFTNSNHNPDPDRNPDSGSKPNPNPESKPNPGPDSKPNSDPNPKPDPNPLLNPMFSCLFCLT